MKRIDQKVEKLLKQEPGVATPKTNIEAILDEIEVALSYIRKNLSRGDTDSLYYEIRSIKDMAEEMLEVAGKIV